MRIWVNSPARWLMLCIATAVPVLAAEDGGAEPSIFAGSLGNSLITLIIFGLVLYILGKTAWKPLLNVLQEREATIREAIEAARRDREEAERKLAEYRAQLEQARTEAAELVAEGRRDAEAVRQRIKEEARHEGDQMIARARQDIRLATDSARKELHDEVSDLSVRMAARIIQKELSAADHRALVAEALKEIQERGKDGMN